MTPLCLPRGGPGVMNPPGGPGTWASALDAQAPLVPLGTGLSSRLPEPKTGFSSTTQRHVTLTLVVGVCPEFQIQSTFHVLFQHVPHSDGWNV